MKFAHSIHKIKFYQFILAISMFFWRTAHSIRSFIVTFLHSMPPFASRIKRSFCNQQACQSAALHCLYHCYKGIVGGHWCSISEMTAVVVPNRCLYEWQETVVMYCWHFIWKCVLTGETSYSSSEQRTRSSAESKWLLFVTQLKCRSRCRHCCTPHASWFCRTPACYVKSNSEAELQLCCIVTE